VVLRQHTLPLGHVAESGQPTTGVIVRRFFQCSTLPGGEVTSDRQRADIQARLVHWKREDLSFPSSQEIMMQRNWLTAVLCGVCCVPAAGDDFRAADLTKARLDLSVAQMQLAEMRRDALQQLAAEGHASQQELDVATARWLSAQADADMWRFAVARLADHGQLPVASGRRWLMLAIPGLDRLDNAADYELAVPLEHNAKILSRLTARHSSTDSTLTATARSQAVSQLCARLVAADDNVSAEERRWADARRQIAQATDRLQSLSGTGLWVSRERKSAGGELTADHDLRRQTLVTATARRRHAEQRIREARQQWFRRHTAAIASAPHAFSPGEQQWLSYQKTYRPEQAPEAVSITGPLIPTATSSAKLHAASVLFGRTVRAAELDALLENIEDHLQPLFEQQRHSRRMLQQLQIRARQLQDLAAADDFFQEECRWMDDHRRLAEARAEQLQWQLETMQLAREFVQGLRNEDAGSESAHAENARLQDVRPWRVSLKQLLKRREPEGERLVLHAEQRLEERRLVALQTLQAEGCASWKEVTQAKVRIAELDMELRQLDAESQDWRLARKHVAAFCRRVGADLKTDIAALR